MKRLLCRIGIHDWRYSDGCGVYGQEDAIRDCRRCGKHQEIGEGRAWWPVGAGRDQSPGRIP